MRAVRATQTDELVMPRRLAGRFVSRLSRTAPADAPAGDARLNGLTQRERDVLRLLAEGLSDRDIAAALTISTRTVETHVSNILHKLGARNRAEAARRYRAEG